MKQGTILMYRMLQLVMYAEQKGQLKIKFSKEELLIGKAIDLLDSRVERRKKVEDSHDAFGRHVAHQLRDMDYKDYKYT